MANRKPIQVLQYNYPEQRLGDKTLFNTAVNGGTTRYFSGIDAEIYFGETYIDEAVQIQFTLQQNTMPLFGYNSFVYDQIAQGSRMIQGQFVVNFTKAGYMYEVLNALSDVASGSSMNVVADQENTSQEQNAAKTAAKKLAMDDHNPLWGKAFEICMSYGDAKISNAPNSTMLLLSGVWLTGVSQSYGISGEPIYETYSFIARDIKLKPVLSGSSAATQKAADSEDVIVITDMTYSEYLDGSNKPFGQLNVSYNRHAIIEKVMFEPKLTLTSARGLVEISTDTTANTGSVNYMVPAAWRAAIKKYCTPATADDKVPNTFDANLSFKYSVNGASATKALTGKVRILDVYVNL